MKILLDENLPRKLADHLIGHMCRTAVECGWSGKKNGELLGLADTQFDVRLTLDNNLPYQQNLDTTRIAVRIVRARSNRIQELLPIMPTSAGSPRRCGVAALTPTWIRTQHSHGINSRNSTVKLSPFSMQNRLAPHRGHMPNFCRVPATGVQSSFPTGSVYSVGRSLSCGLTSSEN